MKNSQTIKVYDHWNGTEINLGGYGGAIYFLSRIQERIIMELTLGAIGNVESRQIYWDGEDVDVTAVVPITFGIRYDILSPYHENSISPYLSFGVGAYWVGDIQVREQHYDHEEVLIESETRPGFYAGVGFNFNLTKVFAINYDMRYHVVDFTDNRFENGFEIGIGFSFMWGKFKK
jgi:outer membrane protein W